MSRLALFYTIILVLKVQLREADSEAYENKYGPLYGDDWMFITDAVGNPHYVNLTYIPEEPDRARIMGDVYFHLFTRQNTEDPELLSISDDNVESTYFNKSNNLKIITHGWQSSGDTEWILLMKDTYLKNSDINVITVDWSDYSILEYCIAAMMTRYVGRRVAEMADAIDSSYGLTGARMHFIGHSLGAQVMGYAGSFSSGNIARITGLDPANPLFEHPSMGDSRRLDSSDADFVDIIHTCGGVLGYKHSHGDADFYPNGGTVGQPGCSGVQYMLEACNHGRAYEYFTRSIDHADEFTAYPCGDWGSYRSGDCPDNPDVMGEHASAQDQGDYYLECSLDSS